MAASSLRKVWIAIALAAGAVVAIVAGQRLGHEIAHRRETSKMAGRVSGMNSGESTLLRAGDPFPDVELVAQGGAGGSTDRTSARELISGREALVLFMTTECEPCTEAVRRWSESAGEIPSGVVVFGVIDQPPDVRDAYVDAHQVAFPVFSDHADKFDSEYGMSAFPTLAAIDANGNIAFVRHGIDAGFTPRVAVETLRAGISERH